jgi:hypothetical protein
VFLDFFCVLGVLVVPDPDVVSYLVHVHEYVRRCF